MDASELSPLISIYKLIKEARSPKRADRSGAGYLPSRAMRFCDAVTSATAFGYWVFPPTSFRLLWDGEQIVWSLDEDEPWRPLSGTDSGAIQFPGFADAFDDLAPETLRGYAPPFITSLAEHGSVQIWSGLCVKTRPGWSVNVRAPVNIPAIPGLATWEGIIETDLWFGPLFTNFRLTKTDFPVVIRADTPFLQIQPVPQLAYRDDLLSDMHDLSPEAMDDEDWRKLSDVLLPSASPQTRQGDYAVAVRKRRLCPVSHRRLVGPDSGS